MWMVLPTKGCKCQTWETLREVVDETGSPVTGGDVTHTPGFMDVLRCSANYDPLPGHSRTRRLSSPRRTWPQPGVELACARGDFGEA